MERALHLALMISTLCVISYSSKQIAAAAGNYERAHRMLDNVNDSGSISIDCGANNDYLDEETGFWYQTDENFVETGDSINVPGSELPDLNYPFIRKQLKTLRCFPEGERNCYTLTPQQGTDNSSRYLIRAIFSYGNYDGKNENQSFDLYLGVNLWDTIQLLHGYRFAQIIHTAPSSETIQVCLVKTGQTNPCISSLELRPLNSSIYPIITNTTPQPLLSSELAIDVGFNNDSRYSYSRYRDDIYGRIWRYDTDVPTFVKGEKIWESGDKAIGFDAYRVPAEVLRTASQSENVSSSLNFDFNAVFKALEMNSEYHVYFHFTEIQQLQAAGKKRVIDRIALNSNHNILSQPLVLEYLKPLTIAAAIANADNVNFSIHASSESDAPPILNAFQIYKLINRPDSPSHPTDAGAMMDIKGAYKISKVTWQGDPCLPIQFKWEGLTCNYSDTNARITSLNLRSSNLKGALISSFSNLKELTFLDLSDNELEGPLPDFLAELPKLEVLNLTGNKFSGSIPEALKEKAKTTLQLRFLL